LPGSPTSTSTPCAPRSPRPPRTPTTPPSSGGSAPCRPPQSQVRQLPGRRKRTTLHYPHRPCHRSSTRSWGGLREATPEGLPFRLADYLELVNWTGRAVRDDKRGAIAEGSAANLGAHRHHPSGMVGAGRGLRDHLLQLDRSSQACRAGLASKGASAGCAASALAGGCFSAEWAQHSR